MNQISVTRIDHDRALVHVDADLLASLKHPRLQVAIGLALAEAGVRADAPCVSATELGREYHGTAQEYIGAAASWSEVHTKTQAVALLKEAKNGP